jgi:hypothetical protein
MMAFSCIFSFAAIIAAIFFVSLFTRYGFTPGFAAELSPYFLDTAFDSFQLLITLIRLRRAIWLRRRLMHGFRSGL